MTIDEKGNPLTYRGGLEEPKQETLEEASLLSRPIHLIWDEDERYDCNEEFREEPKKVLTEEDIFNQRDIDAVTDYINRETSKQETLEEVAERILHRNEIADGDMILSCTFPNTVKSMVEMAKWQAERMYSEEDVKTAFLDGWQLRDGNLPFPKAKRKWFNEFKNKIINGNQL